MKEVTSSFRIRDRARSYCIILRESEARIDIVDFVHESRDLDRLIDGLAGMT